MSTGTVFLFIISMFALFASVILILQDQFIIGAIVYIISFLALMMSYIIDIYDLLKKKEVRKKK